VHLIVRKFVCASCFGVRRLRRIANCHFLLRWFSPPRATFGKLDYEQPAEAHAVLFLPLADKRRSYDATIQLGTAVVGKSHGAVLVIKTPNFQ
jgi:hypothetical protein